MDELARVQEEVRVSDISQYLNITTPSVTKLIQELEKMKALKKDSQKEDKRVSLVCLTDYGLELQEKYVTNYHKEWADKLQDVTQDEEDTVIRVIKRLSETMPGNSLINKE